RHVHAVEITAHHRFTGADEGVDAAGPAEGMVDVAGPEAVVREVGGALQQVECFGRHMAFPHARLAAERTVATQGRGVPLAGADLWRALSRRCQVDLAAEFHGTAVTASMTGTAHARSFVFYRFSAWYFPSFLCSLH